MRPVLHPDFREFLFSLTRHDVRFVVIGAHVLATLGRPRFSDDLDVFVDASTGIDGVSFEEAWIGRKEHHVGTVPIPFLGKNEYIRTKRAADRPKDRADLALLQEAGLLDDR